MNSKAVEALLKEVERYEVEYNEKLKAEYELIDNTPVTAEEIEDALGYPPRSLELKKAAEGTIRRKYKYEARQTLKMKFNPLLMCQDLTRLMELEAEDTIFDDGGTSEAKAIAEAIGRHMEAFNKIAQPRARELYMKYNELIPKEQKPTGYPMDDTIRGVDNIAKYIGMAKSTCQRALKMGEIPGTWQDGSRWKMSISKYESLKFNKQ